MKYEAIIKTMIIVCALFSLLSCTRGIKVTTGNEIIELPGFSPVRGYHCESTSIMNALHYQGLPLSESMINGLASSISFTFQKEGGFPFLGGRTLFFIENFVDTTGLKAVIKQPDNPEDAYREVKSILQKGIPVVLRVDMRYLPYRHNGNYGNKYTTFGWHFVTLVKIDEQEGYAYVTETNNDGLQAVEKIHLFDLAKARDSKEGFLQADNYYYYFENPDKHAINYNDALKKSLCNTLETINEDTLESMSNLPHDLMNIESYIKTKYMLQPLFFTFYGYIEKFGTGGSAFRKFYHQYLTEIAVITEKPEILIAADSAKVSAKKWSKLAKEFYDIQDNINKYKNDKEKRNKLYKNAALKADEVYRAENRMILTLREVYNTL